MVRPWPDWPDRFRRPCVTTREGEGGSKKARERGERRGVEVRKLERGERGGGGSEEEGGMEVRKLGRGEGWWK